MKHTKTFDIPSTKKTRVVKTTCDICGKCFDTRLITWLVSLGVEPISRDWDW